MTSSIEEVRTRFNGWLRLPGPLSGRRGQSRGRSSIPAAERAFSSGWDLVVPAKAGSAASRCVWWDKAVCNSESHKAQAPGWRRPLLDEGRVSTFTTGIIFLMNLLFGTYFKALQGDLHCKQSNLEGKITLNAFPTFQS